VDPDRRRGVAWNDQAALGGKLADPSEDVAAVLQGGDGGLFHAELKEEVIDVCVRPR
jgi:hypothetical protein